MLQTDKTAAGKKLVAARVAAHCEAHSDVMEYQVLAYHHSPYLYPIRVLTLVP